MNEKMTVSCGNVFEDLGFPPDEAAAMQARETLLIALEKELRKRGKTQRELAKELGVSRSRDSRGAAPQDRAVKRRQAGGAAASGGEACRDPDRMIT
ncbi:XRE family transcriptional regulator [Fodinibius sp.]|uniref:XRE family transcriptional regulator n=1 Tax=Fodinibius sp. TaxID=1872440 RepID=UPI002ACDA5BF|nr:XRE family transcriptional regulator [Fodinibius sp.]MDZ7659436.1 hypothetical protein [Fodinibius sp.]